LYTVRRRNVENGETGILRTIYRAWKKGGGGEGKKIKT